MGFRSTSDTQQNGHNGLEEKLKHQYYLRVGPPIFREVRVSRHSPNSEWRWIDAVHILGRKDVRRFIVCDEKSRRKFAHLVSGCVVEVIEAKRKLNRSVIGQAIVAKYLFKMEYPKARAVRPVVIYRKGEGDTVLEAICEKMHVKAVPLAG